MCTISVVLQLKEKADLLLKEQLPQLMGCEPLKSEETTILDFLLVFINGFSIIGQTGAYKNIDLLKQIEASRCAKFGLSLLDG